MQLCVVALMCGAAASAYTNQPIFPLNESPEVLQDGFPFSRDGGPPQLVRAVLVYIIQSVYV